MFDDLEVGYESIPGYKLGLHILQIIFAFTAWCLEIAVFKAEDSTINGQNGWTFAVCFLTLPAWIYLIGAPRYPRTRKIANPYAMVAVDSFYTILWLSAFATQAAYNTANLCGKGCSLSKAVVGLGFFVTLFFGGTTAISIMTLKYYKFNDRLPGYDKIQMKNQNIDPDKAAFSMAPHDEEAYAPIHSNDHDNDHHDDHGYNDHGYGAGSGQDQDPYANQDPYAQDPYRVSPAIRPSENPFDDSSEYRPQTGGAGRIYAPPTIQDDYDDDRPAQFPAGNYDRAVH